MNDWYDVNAFEIPSDEEIILRGMAKYFPTEEGYSDLLFEPTAWKPVDSKEPTPKKEI